MHHSRTCSPSPTPRRPVGISAARGALIVALISAFAGDGCTDGGGDRDRRPRGSGLPTATLAPDEVARAYDVALEQAFDRGPGLSLLLSPALLPRSGGYDTTARVPDPLAAALQATGAFRGTCTPIHDRRKNAPRCDAAMPGYAIRVSEAFRMPGDSLRLYLTAERYRGRPDSALYASPLHFEERYTLVRGRGGWIVARKERMMLS